METNSAISLLAQTLRDHSDKILRSECKLILSEYLLRIINKSFVLLSEQKDAINSFQIISSNNIDSNFLRDIKFLHDILRRTSSLKLVRDVITENSDQLLDISAFKNIKYFELHKVNVNKVKGIQALRAQIQCLVCRWTYNSLSEILEKCGYDESQGFVWNELKDANFSHNTICSLNQTLELVPWLHTLDLSHNSIKDAQPLNCLLNLKHLNLSYNHIESIPIFSGQICGRLQVLILHNNFIENIDNVINLVNLCELYLGDNCLINHDKLWPLSYLATLQWLTLEGNPLSYHPQYRIKTVCYLNSNIATFRFCLDGKILTKTESKKCGKIQPFHHRPQITQSVSLSCSEATLVASDRPRRVRTATISDGFDDSEMNASVTSVCSLLTSLDHLETKKTIESLRRQYGEKWLHCQSGSMVQDALGLDKSLPLPSPSYEISDMPNINNVAEIKSNESNDGNDEYTTASDMTIGHDDDPYSADTPVRPNSATDNDDDDDDVLGEGEESLYLVTPKNDSEPIFLVVSNNHIWERDCSSGKEKTRWSVDSLLACYISGTDPVYIALEFDTVKRDKQNREYEIDKDDGDKLSKLLNNLLSISESHNKRMILLKCMKCGTKFGEERNRQTQRNESRVCPNPTCSSTLVIEDD